MKLIDYLRQYEGMAINELEAIVCWAIQEKKQLELIKLIGELATTAKEDADRFKHRATEWCGYAISLRAIDDVQNFQHAVNIVRMAHLGYPNDEQFCNYIYKLLETKGEFIQLDYIKDMHPDIYKRYQDCRNLFTHAAHCCKEHGCKYGKEYCPVANGEIEQKYKCIDCESENENDN